MNEATTPGRDSSTPATIVDIAKVAGVSHSTVSRALNDHPHVKAETRRHVHEVAERLGYVANLHARGLAGGRLGAIGLVVMDLTSSYITEIVRSVDGALAEAGHDLLLCTTHKRTQSERSYVNQLSVGLVDGLIVVIPTTTMDYAEDLIGRRFPFVLVDHASTPGVTSIDSDSTAGTNAIVDHLVELGHTRIGTITGDLRRDAGVERLVAYRNRLAVHGLPIADELIVHGDFTETNARAPMEALLDLDDPPTAVFASSDEAAFAALRVAQERGIAVPEQLSIVGYDDISEAARSRPSLTTVSQPIIEMSQRAVELLLQQIEDPTRSPAHIRFPSRFIARESTGPAPTR